MCTNLVSIVTSVCNKKKMKKKSLHTENMIFFSSELQRNFLFQFVNKLSFKVLPVMVTLFKLKDQLFMLISSLYCCLCADAIY